MINKEEIVKEILAIINKPKDLYVEIIRDGIKLPTYAHEGDAGMDIRAAIDVVIEPNTTVVVPTGLKVAIPEGYELQIRPRSGLSLKTSLRLPNAPGTVDSGYRDELGIIVHNISLTESFEIKKGDRIAQLVLNKYEQINVVQVEKDGLNNIGTNRHGGFGSSGIN
jgi:dUTP pyrophosphatase